jgi:cytosine permease
MSRLPDYVAAAKPVPWENRAGWYKTITPTYAGVMLWFVFWQALAQGTAGSPGGVLTVTIGWAFLGLILGAVICHFFFYMAPAMLGVRTGLPLYVIGTSTYGVRGGLYMPGFLMGLLQFGWLGVNSFFVARILCKCFNIGQVVGETGAADTLVPSWPHGLIATAFVVIAAFVGLKGIQYVARVATWLPLIPVAVLIILLAYTWSGLSHFDWRNLASDDANWDMRLSGWEIIGVLVTYIVGFFATAGAAGVDIAANARNEDDVHIGGLTGIVLPTVLAGEAVLLIVAGAYGLVGPDGTAVIKPEHVGNLNPVDLMPDVLGSNFANILMIGLAISSFPGACFSSFIAANSFKTTMPKINPYITVGLGAVVSAVLAVSGWAGNVIQVFIVIGASFGPVCGAMLADFWLSRCRWSGPRAGFNAAGWISWIVGFVVGAFNLVVDWLLPYEWATNAIPDLAAWKGYVPVPPVTAMVVGLVLYLVLSWLGLRSRKLEMAEPAM